MALGDGRVAAPPLTKGPTMDDPHDATPCEPNQQPTVRDAMRPAVATVERHAHVAAAAYLMRQAHESALVVTTDGASRRPIAIITDTDLARAVAEGKDVNEAHIDELANLQPITVQPDTAVSDAIALMVSAGIRHLPVVSDGRLVGMFDITDAHRAVSGANGSAQRKA
jgi:CBS domain-containing protein